MHEPKHALGGIGWVLAVGSQLDFSLQYFGFHRLMCKYAVPEHPFSTNLNIHVVGKIARHLLPMRPAGHNNYACTWWIWETFLLDTKAMHILDSRWTQQLCMYLMDMRNLLAGYKSHARTWFSLDTTASHARRHTYPATPC